MSIDGTHYFYKRIPNIVIDKNIVKLTSHFLIISVSKTFRSKFHLFSCRDRNRQYRRAAMFTSDIRNQSTISE